MQPRMQGPSVVPPQDDTATFPGTGHWALGTDTQRVRPYIIILIYLVE